jgi:phosphate transport system permease protein
MQHSAFREDTLRRRRLLTDTIAGRFMCALTVTSCAIVLLMAIGLYWRSRPILAVKPIHELLFGTSWHPLRGEFGFFPFLMGTIWVTGVSIVLAIPLSVMTSIYLSEYAHRLIRTWTKPLVDLLAGIPSVVFGVWGVIVVVPLIQNFISPHVASAGSGGYCVLAGGIVLAIMVLPIIIHVSLEVLQTVPRELREASLALGATKWQTIKHVVIRKAIPGIIAALVLGLSRAFGETMAVLMVVGNVARIPSSVFDAAYPLPALIANNYGEMLSVPLYDSALLFASFILLLVIIAFNVLARLVLVRVERKIR